MDVSTIPVAASRESRSCWKQFYSCVGVIISAPAGIRLNDWISIQSQWPIYNIKIMAHWRISTFYLKKMPYESYCRKCNLWTLHEVSIPIKV